MKTLRSSLLRLLLSQRSCLPAERASVLIEFPFIFLVLMTFIFGFIDLSRYMMAKAVLDKSAFIAVQEASIIPNLYENTSTPLNKALEFSKLVFNTTDPQATAYLPPLDDLGNSNPRFIFKDGDLEVNLQEATADGLEKLLEKNPIRLEMKALMRPVSPFVPPITIQSKVVSWREVGTTPTMPIVSDCFGNPYYGSAVTPNKSACECAQQGFNFFYANDYPHNLNCDTCLPNRVLKDNQCLCPTGFKDNENPYQPCVCDRNWWKSGEAYQYCQTVIPYSIPSEYHCRCDCPPGAEKVVDAFGNSRCDCHSDGGDPPTASGVPGKWYASYPPLSLPSDPEEITTDMKNAYQNLCRCTQDAAGNVVFEPGREVGNGWTWYDQTNGIKVCQPNGANPAKVPPGSDGGMFDAYNCKCTCWPGCEPGHATDERTCKCYDCEEGFTMGRKTIGGFDYWACIPNEEQ